jgi:WD40 repeat protein
MCVVFSNSGCVFVCCILSFCVQDGKTVVSGSYDKTVRVWDAATGKEVQKLEGHWGLVGSVAFSPVGGVELLLVL